MSKFHSLVSRRTIMKHLGLAGVGIGAASLAGPVFHDLDELMSSPSADSHHPWYVKEVDMPTMEIDWATMKRHDPTMNTNTSPTKFIPTWTDVLAQQATLNKKWLVANSNGFALRDKAAADNAALQNFIPRPWMGTDNRPMYAGLAVSNGVTATPDTLGVPKWQGTPAEASRMVRSYQNLLGAPMVGFMEINNNTQKLIYNNISIENAPVGSLKADGTMVLPNIPLWGIGFGVPMSPETMRTAPSFVSTAGKSQTEITCYGGGYVMQRFITEIGYHAYWGGKNTIGPHPGFRVFGGEGEVGRCLGKLINPDFGLPMLSCVQLTDLPLEPNNPIDAGILRFCHNCAKCASVCGSGALTNDAEPSWDVMGTYNAPGHKQYMNDTVKCKTLQQLVGGTACNICQSACVFTKKNSSLIHSITKGTIANTGVFNGFFKNMDDRFGYGNRQFSPGNSPVNDVFNDWAPKWWDKEIPAYGFDLSLPY